MRAARLGSPLRRSMQIGIQSGCSAKVRRSTSEPNQTSCNSTSCGDSSRIFALTRSIRPPGSLDNGHASPCTFHDRTLRQMSRMAKTGCRGSHGSMPVQLTHVRVRISASTV